MRTFDLDRRFRCIFVASNSFSHLYSRADVEACLVSVRRHLAPSGRFVVDVFNPALSLFVRPPERRSPVAEYDDSHSGGRLAVSKAVRYDSATQISHETWYFRYEVSGEEQAVPLNLRMFFPQRSMPCCTTTASTSSGSTETMRRRRSLTLRASRSSYVQPPMPLVNRSVCMKTHAANSRYAGADNTRVTPKYRGSQIFRSQSRPLGDSRQHPRSNLVLIVKRKLVVRPVRTREQPMRATLAFNSPADPLQCGEDPPCLTGGPVAHPES
jgi:hypothetical protein